MLDLDNSENWEIFVKAWDDTQLDENSICGERVSYFGLVHNCEVVTEKVCVDPGYYITFLKFNTPADQTLFLLKWG
jgi:hypothetical protein